MYFREFSPVSFQGGGGTNFTAFLFLRQTFEENFYHTVPLSDDEDNYLQ